MFALLVSAVMVSAPIDPLAPPAGMQVVIAGTQGFDGTYTFTRTKSTPAGQYPAHHIYVCYPVGGDPSKVNMAITIERYSATARSMMQFRVCTKGLNADLTIGVVAPQTGTLPMNVGTATFSAL